MKSITITSRKDTKPSSLIYFTFPYIIIILLSLKTFYFRYVAFGFVIMFVIVFLISNKKLLVKRKYLFLLCFLASYLVFGILSGNPLQTIKNMSMFIVSLAPFFIFDWIFSTSRIEKRIQNATLLLKIITPMLLYTIVVTLYYLFSNPYIARYMANFDPSRGIDASMGISIDLPTAIGGGYTLIYGVILLPSVFLYLAKNVFKRNSIRIVSIGMAIFLLYFIIKSGFATAFILTIVGCMLTLSSFKTNKLFSRLAIISSLLFVSFIFFNEQILADIIRIITNLLPLDSIITVRLNEIIPAIYGSTVNSSFSNRLEGLEKSLSAFTSNPLLGVGFKAGYDYTSIAAYTGLHTEWLDLMSQYGLILGIPLLVYIFLTFSELIKLFEGTSMDHLIKQIVFMVIIVGFFNPILNTSIFIISLLFIPSILLIFLEKNKNDLVKD